MSAFSKIIPARDEDSLSKVWPALCRIEGHMKRHPMSDARAESARVEHVKKYLDDGLSHSEIAVKLGVSRGRISNMIATHGLTSHEPPDDIDAIQRLLNEGLTYQDIAIELSIPFGRVKRLVSIHKLVRPPRVDTEVPAIREMRREKMEQAEIGERLGISKRRVEYLVRKHGIPYGA